MRFHILTLVGAALLSGITVQQALAHDDNHRGHKGQIVPIIRAAETSLTNVIDTADDGGTVLFATLMRSDSGDNDGDPVWVAGIIDTNGDSRLRSFHIDSGEQLTDNSIFWGMRKFDSPFTRHRHGGSSLRSTLNSADDLAANPVAVSAYESLGKAEAATDADDQAVAVTLSIKGDIRYYSVHLLSNDVESTPTMTVVSLDADTGKILAQNTLPANGGKKRGRHDRGHDDDHDDDHDNASEY